MSQFRFYLNSEILDQYDQPLGRVLIEEPVGWDTRKPTLTRNTTYGGLFRSFTVNLEFIGSGYSYVKTAYNQAGILANVFIEIWEYNNSDHEYQLQDTGILDFTTYKESDKSKKGISVNISDTSFIEKIKNRESILINYNDSKTLDGNDLSNDPIYVDQKILGMDVIESGMLTIKDSEYGTFPDLGFSYFPGISSNSSIAGINNYEISKDPDLPTTPPQIPDLNNVVVEIMTQYPLWDGQEWLSFFIAQKDQQILLNGELKFDFKLEDGDGEPAGRIFKVQLIKLTADYVEGSTFQVLAEYISPNTEINIIYENQILPFVDLKIDLLRNEKLVIRARMEDGTVYINPGWCVFKQTEIEIKTSTKADPTISKGAFIFDIINRMIESISGISNKFNSTVFQQGGIYHDYTIQNGFLIRNYTQNESQLSFKFKELFQDLEKIFNVGLSIDNDFVEIRDKRDFFQNGVILTIGPNELEADSFIKSLDTDFFYSDIEIGYTKSAYEEVSGLEEYNNKSYYSTIISNLNNKLDAVSKTRADGFGIEFARRKQKNADTTEDTEYDKDNFLLNVIYDDELGQYKQKTNEDFVLISGIDEITTPVNLSITPAQNLFRWGWMLSAGLQKYLNNPIKFNSSDVISDLSTVGTNGKTVYENVDISISELDSPIFTGFKIQFSAPLSLSDYNMLKNSDNKYKLIKVWNPIDEEYNFGWIREASVEAVDKSTNWELIEAKEIIEIIQRWIWNDGSAILWNDGGSILLNQ